MVLRRTRLAAVVLLAVTSLIVSPTVVAVQGENVGSAHDYLQTAGLSAPRFETEHTSMTVLMPDRVPLYVEVTRPKAQGRFPVILEASPYHGTLADRDGTRILPLPLDRNYQPLGLTRYFAPRGYAVVMVDLRGTGLSGGCLDHLGPDDASDVKTIVEWAAAQPWSNGRVGMTGHSYVGSTPSMAAAQRPKGLATIVPSAGLASMYDHQFQAGVPYFFQWAGPMFAYEQIAIQRDLPGGEHFGTDPTSTGCGLPATSLTEGEAQTSGQYTDWHAARDYRAGATDSPIPMFLVHGVNDNAARIPAAEWFFARRNAADKIWLGQWDHGSGCCPNRRGLQWAAALHVWFDRHLVQRDVDTGPSIEAFLGDGATLDQGVTARTEVLTGGSWPMPTLAYEMGTDVGVLGPDESNAGSVSFAGSPDSSGLAFVSRPLWSDLVVAGLPTLRLVASVTAPRVHLIANVYDEDPEGNRRRISQFAINPELRSSLRVPEVVVPGQRYVMHPPGFAMAHHIKAGHRIVLAVTTSDPDKVPTFAIDPRITVFVGAGGTRLRLPVIDDPQLVADAVKVNEDGNEPG